MSDNTFEITYGIDDGYAGGDRPRPTKCFTCRGIHLVLQIMAEATWKTVSKGAMTKAQKTIVRRWAHALRSGAYPQGERTLHTQDARSGADSWCCLGVLCDLAVSDGVIPAPTTFEHGAKVYRYASKNKKDMNSGTIPNDVLRWVGLQTHDGTFHTPNLGRTSLAALNDIGMTFESIATLIESKPEGLFY
jgi:hypothetical protein